MRRMIVYACKMLLSRLEKTDSHPISSMNCNNVNAEKCNPAHYPPELLLHGGDNPNPIGKVLERLKNEGHEVDGAIYQLLSLQHHLESHMRTIKKIEKVLNK